MGQGDLELEKKRKPVEIKVTRDAEDAVKEPDTAFMVLRPMETEVHSQTAGQNPHEVLDQAEKKWVSDGMEKLTRKAGENRRAERDRLSVHIPADTVLSDKHEGRFSSSISDKRRKEKLKNPKSGLYREGRNADPLEENVSDPQETLDRTAQEQEIAIDQPIESEEQAEIYNAQAAWEQDREEVYAGRVMKTLLTSDELIPLKGTREMAAVRRSIYALQDMLAGEMPPVTLNDSGEVDPKAEAEAIQEINGTCISVVTLYKKMTDSIDRLVYRYGPAYSDLAAMLKDLSAQCKSEGVHFREKVLEYRSIVSGDTELRSGTRSWSDALKYSRGVFYDLDNDKSLSVKTEGAGASSLLKITREVPVTGENPEGRETVYFRTRDLVPPADNKEFVSRVMARHEVSEETAQKLTRAFLTIQSSGKILGVFANRIKAHKGQHSSYDRIAKDILSEFNKVLNDKTDIPKEEYETAGRIIVDWKDDISKRAMAHDMSISAKIENDRPLADRNVVISRLAQMFGIGDMVCDSRSAVVRMNGKVIEGNIMENTGGTDTWTKPRAYTQKAISQLFILQTFDYIGGQTDRHFGNFHAKLRDEQYDQIRSLDNDMSCGLLKPADIGDKPYNQLLPVTDVSLMGLPVSFVNRLMGMDRAYLDQVAGDILDLKELDAMEERLNYVKLRLINLAENSPDANWDGSSRQFSYNGYMADDAYRQLWAVDKIQTKAFEREDREMGYLSKFRTRNMEATPVKTMMTERRRIMDEQRQGDKGN